MGAPAIPERRPRVVVVQLVLLAFLAVTAIGGGLEMLLFPQGNPFVKAEWLDSVPFDDWILPGLILGVGFGLGSALVLLPFAPTASAYLRGSSEPRPGT
ncbi:MAG: hypothetical protein AB1Z67_08065 [Candidatus Limnocylindrales bacterium]